MINTTYEHALKRDIQFYLSRKAGYPFIAPEVLQLSLTNRCNLHCRSCRVWQEQSDEGDELQFAEIKDIIDESVAWGIREIHLLGGEPLLRDDWQEVVTYIKQKDVFLVICTNGTCLIQAGYAEFIRENVDLISISLDGARPETHDFLRAEKGSYNKILSGIQALNQYRSQGKVRLVLIMTISNKNFSEIKEYVDVARSLLADSIYLTALVEDNVNLGDRNVKSGLWIEERFFDTLPYVFKEGYEYAKNNGYYLDYPSFRLLARYFQGNLKEGEWVCFAGFKRIVVTHTGQVQICGKLVGDYRQQKSLQKIWKSRAAFQRRRFVKTCKNYCLQDCHARPASDSLSHIMNQVW